MEQSVSTQHAPVVGGITPDEDDEDNEDGFGKNLNPFLASPDQPGPTMRMLSNRAISFFVLRIRVASSIIPLAFRDFGRFWTLRDFCFLTAYVGNNEACA